MARPLSTEQYKQIAVQAARHWGIPVQPFLRQLTQESGWRPGVTSSAGAKWIGQFIPSTAKAYGVHDDVSSIWGAAHYMSDNLKKYGSMERALSAYNSGRPDAYLDPHFANGQTWRYVRSIMGGHEDAAAATGAQQEAPGMSPGVPSPQTPSVDVAAQSRKAALGGLAQIASGTKPTEAFGNVAGLISKLKQVTPAFQAQMADGSYAPQAGGNSTTEAKAVKLAQKYLGVHYVWGGESPQGFDCSGLLQYVWSNLGVNIPRTTYDQWKAGTPVGIKGLKAGDAVFFRGSDARGNLPGHVGIYMGNGKFIEAPHTGAVVRISNLAGRKDYVGARRYG